MALKKCSHCGKEVSEYSTQCVHCGGALRRKSRIAMTPQQLFDEACAQYKKLVRTIKIVGLVLESADEFSYSTEIALRQMDRFLQYILLTQAISDGELDNYESQFIDLITNYDDILQWFNARNKTHVDWDSLQLYNERTIGAILSGVTHDVYEGTMDFIAYFAAADAILTDHNYYDDIKESIVTIAECLAYIDGDPSDNEGKRLFEVLFGNYYLEQKAHWQGQIAKRVSVDSIPVDSISDDD